MGRAVGLFLQFGAGNAYTAVPNMKVLPLFQPARIFPVAVMKCVEPPASMIGRQDHKDGITSRQCQCHGNAKDANAMLKGEIKIYCGFYNGTRMQRACYVVQDCQNLRM